LLAILTVEQREALVLIEAARLSYKEAARICRRPFLSFRKFVEQARTDLARVLSPDGPQMFADEVVHRVLDELAVET
jgi:DNA-directed RNA polymerase specialized sigma24 family protein